MSQFFFWRKQAVSEPGNGRVLVVDGGASLRCALLGGNLAADATRNGWQVGDARIDKAD